MPLAFYIVPVIGSGATPEDPIRAKHQLEVPSTRTSCDKIGSWALLAINAPETSLDIIRADPAAIELATEADMESSIPGNRRNALRAAMEAAGLPGGLVGTGDTQRAVVRRLKALACFSGSLRRRFGADLAGLSLDSTWADLPAGVQAQVQAVIEEYGLDIVPLDTDTLRDLIPRFGAILRQLTMADMVL